MQQVVYQAIDSPGMDAKNISSMVNEYVKYNIVSKSDTPDILSVFSVNQNEVDEFEQNDFNDDQYTVYYFWHHGKIHAARETYSRVALLHDSVLNEIGYLKQESGQKSWYNGYECHLEPHRYLFIEIPVVSYKRYLVDPENTRYTPVSCFELIDTFDCFDEFKKSLHRRLRTFSKLIKVKTIEFYYELSIVFNKEVLFSIKDSEGDYQVQSLDGYTKIVDECCELMKE